MLYGIAATSAVAAGVVMAGIPAAVALLSWVFLHERISLRNMAAIVLAVGGVSMLAIARDDAGTLGAGAAWGYVLLVGAVFCEATYVVVGKQLTRRLGPKRISALINLWGLVLMTPFGLVQAVEFDFTAVDGRHWGLLVFYALAASMVTVWLWMRGLKRVSAPRAGVFSVLLPVAATVIGVTVLGEPFGTLHAVALGLSLGGLLMATWPERAPPPLA